MATQRTKASMNTQIDAIITTGITGGITGATHNALEKDLTESIMFNNFSGTTVINPISTGVKITGAGVVLNITGSAAGSSNNAYIGFYDSGATQQGNIGFSGGSDNHMRIINTTADGDMIFKTNNTTAITITAASIIEMVGSGLVLKIKGSAAGASNNAYIGFNDGSDAMQGSIGFSSAADSHLRLVNETATGDMIFKTNNTTVLTLDSDGNVIITGIPTSSAGLPSGSLWSNSGVITIV